MKLLSLALWDSQKLLIRFELKQYLYGAIFGGDVPS